MNDRLNLAQIRAITRYVCLVYYFATEQLKAKKLEEALINIENQFPVYEAMAREIWRRKGLLK
jgi:hypothetical protein